MFVSDMEVLETPHFIINQKRKHVSRTDMLPFPIIISLCIHAQTM